MISRPVAPVRAPRAAAYHGLPLLKAPVWTWEIGSYFFVGGLAGMSGVLALALWIFGPRQGALLEALSVAVAGCLLSAVLLVMDLGRPARFLYMLRVFKWRSPMSVGVWLLSAYGAGASIALGLGLGYVAGGHARALAVLEWIVLPPTAVLGSLVATYTGVLIGATAIPAWHARRRLLPLHFGTAGLGSAAALLELLGHAGAAALGGIGYVVSGVETLIGLYDLVRSRGRVDAALRHGRAAWMLHAATLAAGPGALLARVLGAPAVAAALFLCGALLSRFGWLEAGRASSRDPLATLEEQRGTREPAAARPRA